MIKEKINCSSQHKNNLKKVITYIMNLLKNMSRKKVREHINTPGPQNHENN